MSTPAKVPDTDWTEPQGQVLESLDAVRANEIGTAPLRARSGKAVRFAGQVSSYKDRDDVIQQSVAQQVPGKMYQIIRKSKITDLISRLEGQQ